MARYMTGCVNDGSSPSLWPWRRYVHRSMTTSLWKRWRKSTARRTACATASRSSPFTWMIGIWSIRAGPVQYVVERASWGEVVNPTWLFTMTWIVPPTAYPSSSDIWSDSATIPWPAKAASPCTSTGTLRTRSPSAYRSCFARTRPCTTVSIHSRWLGLNESDRWTSTPSGVSRSEE